MAVAANIKGELIATCILKFERWLGRTEKRRSKILADALLHSFELHVCFAIMNPQRIPKGHKRAAKGFYNSTCLLWLLDGSVYSEIQNTGACVAQFNFFSWQQTKKTLFRTTRPVKNFSFVASWELPWKKKNQRSNRTTWPTEKGCSWDSLTALWDWEVCVAVFVVTSDVPGQFWPCEVTIRRAVKKICVIGLSWINLEAHSCTWLQVLSSTQILLSSTQILIQVKYTKSGVWTQSCSCLSLRLTQLTQEAPRFFVWTEIQS